MECGSLAALCGGEAEGKWRGEGGLYSHASAGSRGALTSAKSTGLLAGSEDEHEQLTSGHVIISFSFSFSVVKCLIPYLLIPGSEKGETNCIGLEI